MEKVSMNKGLLIGVVAVAAVSLLALAFLLGRTSESGSPAGQPPGRGLSGGVAAPPAPAPRALAQPLPLPTSAVAWITDLAAPRPAPAPTDGERGSAGSDSARAAVVAYFDAVDHIQPGKIGRAS